MTKHSSTRARCFYQPILSTLSQTPTRPFFQGTLNLDDKVQLVLLWSKLRKISVVNLFRLVVFIEVVFARQKLTNWKRNLCYLNEILWSLKGVVLIGRMNSLVSEIQKHRFWDIMSVYLFNSFLCKQMRSVDSISFDRLRRKERTKEFKSIATVVRAHFLIFVYLCICRLYTRFVWTWWWPTRSLYLLKPFSV